jgi:hypothetical protein
MSKSTVTRLFLAAILALTVGVVMAIVVVIAAVAGGVITIGGPSVVEIDGALFAESLGWLVVAGIVLLGGEIVAIAAWIGALVNSWHLEDKTWFVALLGLGLASLGWIAMVAYVIAGPDGTRASDATRTVPAASS